MGVTCAAPAPARRPRYRNGVPWQQGRPATQATAAPRIGTATTPIQRGYFSLRQLIEPRFSIVLDSTSMSKPRPSRYFSVSTWPVPSSDTP